MRRSRTAAVASIGPGGRPHLVAMWFGIIGEAVYLETKAKSQKAVNLSRDPRMVLMVEAGTSYDTLRGVSIEGNAVIITDSDGQEYWDAAISVYERYIGPYTEARRPAIELPPVVAWPTTRRQEIAMSVDVIRRPRFSHRRC